MPRRLKNVPMTEEDGLQRKASCGTVRSEGGLSHQTKPGIWHIHDSTDSLQFERQSPGSMRMKSSLGANQNGTSRFPKLEDCAHFHYDYVDFGQLQVVLCEEERENYHHDVSSDNGEQTVLLRVCCNNRVWNLRRMFTHFCSLDRQLHRCIFDRKFSQLPELQLANCEVKTKQEWEHLLQSYLRRFSELAGSMINCGSVLNWLEMDNRGNRLLAMDDSGINTPAIAAAHAVKRYTAQAADEISLQVGDIVSVIDMPPVEDSVWWRGKRGFEVGFFPGECVEVIGDKVPPSVASCITTPTPGGRTTPTPTSTPATARKPCEMQQSVDSVSMMKKHGKLMSFLRTFFSTRPARNQLKQSGIVKERVFGCDLGEHLLNSGHDVPLVLKSCAEVIERHGIVDGIYRLSGITSNIQKLRVAFDEDQVPELMEATYLQDIHSISSLLKMYFRELPNPLLTYQLYDKFAAAVKDEDNKLLRIHDVVQQLPPPHYRTTEYLIRHLSRVASHGLETGMHCKNLAIVWAPNLLRSKELELGGGAAALQGVGIQAVVTECLICYCDLIFSDKMPSYSSPHLSNSQKKPRPKSLAISTPTRLLSLEEARERAFFGSLAQSHHYIDVGGGPASLPGTYHTILDLPGYRKKSAKSDANKGKRSPVSTWKSIFSKPRTGSMKKNRKPSTQGDGDSISSIQAKALTEEDVHNWKRRLRSAKSAESLLSLSASSRCSSGSQTSHAITSTDAVPGSRNSRATFYHKRSLSSDASVIFRHHRPQDLPPSSGKASNISSSHDSSPLGQGHNARPDLHRGSPRKQSFVRGDSTRKALHRRIPSAPGTPKMDRSDAQSKSNSQSAPDGHDPSLSDLSLLATPTTDTDLGIDIDAAIKARLQQMAAISRSARSSLTSPGSPEKSSLEWSDGQTDKGKRPGETESNRTQRAERSGSAHGKFFISRYHDYAEILSDDEKDSQFTQYLKFSSPALSSSDMQELVETLEKRLSSEAKSDLHNTTDELQSESLQVPTDMGQSEAKSGVTQVSHRQAEHIPIHALPASSCPNTEVVRRRTDWIPSESSTQQAEGASLFHEVIPRQIVATGTRQVGQLSPDHRDKILVGAKARTRLGMSKCLSVPSDIAKSLENITASQNDLLSSVTISELSQSINSFCTSLNDESPLREDPRWRRSTSLDSLETESSLCRTLHAFNAQIDSAFHHKVDRALQLEEKGYTRHGENSTLTPLYISEDSLTGPKETHFPTSPNEIENKRLSNCHPVSPKVVQATVKSELKEDTLEFVCGIPMHKLSVVEDPSENSAERDELEQISSQNQASQNKKESRVTSTDSGEENEGSLVNEINVSEHQSSELLCSPVNENISKVSEFQSVQASQERSGDLRQFSTDDIMWRQSPLYSHIRDPKQQPPESDFLTMSNNLHTSCSASEYTTSPFSVNRSETGIPSFLHLYHPDEFSVPSTTCSKTGTSLAQVHVNNDTVTEEKAVIKRSSVKKSSTETEISLLQNESDIMQTNWQSLPRDAALCFSPILSSQDHIRKGYVEIGGGMKLEQSEQDAIEVDNLCNKLVDDLQSPEGLDLKTSYSEIPQSISRQNSIQMEAIVECRLEAAGEGAVLEQHLVRLESFGALQDEELQNALNAGKEMLLAHTCSQAPTPVSISVSTSCQVQAKPTHERKLSASRIPRFNRASDGREEKCSALDIIYTEIKQLPSADNSFSGTDSQIQGICARMKDAEQTKQPLMSRVSKIPLSQKMPSPTCGFRDPPSKLVRSADSAISAEKFSSSPHDSPVRSPNTMHSDKIVRDPVPKSSRSETTVSIDKLSPIKSGQVVKSGQCPVPKARVSCLKADIAPPLEEQVEVTRSSFKRKQSVPEVRCERGMLIKEMKMPQGDAKLVIEKQSSLRKKVQTVHAQKVPHPPRQIAEALDSEAGSTGPSDLEHSGLSSQEDEVFVDEGVLRGRKRSFSSNAGTPSRSLAVSPLFGQISNTNEPYHCLTASRSSLDDSALQLAAERHDMFVPAWESADKSGFCTGSLRTRSLKMQSLMELFERVSGANVPHAKFREKSSSASESTTISACSQDKDSDDEMFQPTYQRLPLSTASRHSRSRERGAGVDKKNAQWRVPSQSPVRHLTASVGTEEIGVQRRKPSPVPVTRQSQRRLTVRSECALGRPPRHRSTSRGRTYSDSSTSESDSAHALESAQLQKDTFFSVDTSGSGSGQSDVFSSGEDGCTSVQKHGSFKELRQLFEKNVQSAGEDSGSDPSPPSRRSGRGRVGSLSRVQDVSGLAVGGSMRRSLELPSSVSAVHQGEALLAALPVRLGPKPFYGAKK